jgi:hypothetical protein
MPVVIHDFKMVGADLFPAAIASVSGFCPQQAQKVQCPSDSVLSGRCNHFGRLCNSVDGLTDGL